MDDRTTVLQECDWDDARDGEPQAIGDVLAELLAQYQARFPKVNITVVDVPTAA